MAGSRIFQRASAVVAACAFLGLGSTPAFAHDAVVGGNPADGEVVTEFPTTITLDFSGIPKDGFNTIAVSDQNSQVIFTGEPTVEGQSITIDVPDDLNAGPGEYTIGFQITSSDGHATRGKTTFTVEGAGAPADSAAGSSESNPDAEQVFNENASSSEPTEDSFNPTVAILGSLAAILAVGAMIVLLIRRNKQGQ